AIAVTTGPRPRCGVATVAERWLVVWAGGAAFNAESITDDNNSTYADCSRAGPRPDLGTPSGNGLTAATSFAGCRTPAVNSDCAKIVASLFDKIFADERRFTVLSASFAAASR